MRPRAGTWAFAETFPLRLEWLAELDRLVARYVVVWSPAWYSEAGGRERQAVLSRPERFKQLGRWQSTEMGWVEIYEVKYSFKTDRPGKG